MKTILIVGANGFIASQFKQQFMHKYNFINLSHHPQFSHLTLEQLELQPELLKTIDYVINLAGANIGDKRWSSSRKECLIQSRIDTTRRLVALLNRYQPQIYLLSASAVGIYQPDQENTEFSFIDYEYYGNFSQELTKQWELEVQKYNGPYLIARFGVVLSATGGAFPKMLAPFLKYVGGQLGTGQQYFPWIALPDLLNILETRLLAQSCGIYNLVAPQLVTNQELCKQIARLWQRPNWLKLPAWVIKLIFGQMGQELFLNSLIVKPQKLIDENYVFLYPEISSCLQAIKSKQI
jgi:uncharacterized protein (TIGR01777 family)